MKRRLKNTLRNARIDREYHDAHDPHQQTEGGNNDKPRFVVNIGTRPKRGRKGAGKKATISEITDTGEEIVLKTFEGKHGKDISKQLRAFMLGTSTVIPPTAPLKSYGKTFF
jgi:hypothetical protein